MKRRGEFFSAVSAAGAALYLAVIVSLPLLDRTFDVLRAHPEDYASGRYGLAVNFSYLALATGLVASMPLMARFGRPAIVVEMLVLPAAILCLALAVDPIGVAQGAQLSLLPIVGLAVAPLIASFSFNDRFGRWRRALTGLAVAVLITFLGLVLAPDSVTGIINRAFDSMVGIWLIVFAFAARRITTAGCGTAS